jgi:precorrin-6B methylase 2
MNTTLTIGPFELAGLCAAIGAADATGLLERADERARAAAELAPGCDPLAAARVCAVLAAAGLLVREPDDTFRRGPLLDAAARGPGGLAGLLALWRATPAFLSRGARVARMDGDAADRAAAYASVTEDLGRLFAPAADALAAALPAARAILDVGAGSGVWSLAMAARAPDAQVTALDLAEVLPVFRRRAAALGLADRAHARAGDFHGELGGPYDRVVLANVLHLEDEARAAALIARAAAALAPGGEVVVVDTFAEATGGALAHATYELHLAMRTGGGRAHPSRAIAAWLADARCAAPRVIDLGGALPGLAALVAALR